jgi:mono/diheme cytochrome c family protein
MKKSLLSFLSIITLVIIYSFYSSPKQSISDNDKVADILVKLGDKKPLHYIAPKDVNPEKIKKGFELVTKGITTKANGKKTKKQSKHFVCTDCHNIKVEDPDLTKSNPDSRLDFAIKNNLKFLPGTTMAGVTNREHWYNDDYKKKYGQLVAPARDTLQNAIHLCAVQCSQGRAFEDWEMEAVTQYLTSIGFSIKDLNLTSEEKSQITKALNSNSNNIETIKMIKSKYLTYSPATFVKPIKKGNRELGKNGDAKKGEKIFQLSCLTCHQEEGVTNYKLDKQPLTFKHLKYWSKSSKHFSVYQITRKGTYAQPGYKPYMPNYTKERLSNKQLEDLMAYINSKN